MIKKQINYTIEFTEQQLKELYDILRYQKEHRHLTPDYELLLVYHEVQKIFEKKEDFEYQTYIEDYK